MSALIFSLLVLASLSSILLIAKMCFAEFKKIEEEVKIKATKEISLDFFELKFIYKGTTISGRRFIIFVDEGLSSSYYVFLSANKSCYIESEKTRYDFSIEKISEEEIFLTLENKTSKNHSHENTKRFLFAKKFSNRGVKQVKNLFDKVNQN